jgi:hypothetical protein
LQAQELNCSVNIVSTQVQTTNKDIFDDLKTSIVQFMNNRKWTEEKIQNQERIDCTFIIEILKFNIDQFEGRITIQSSRPVYGTDYNSIIFKHIDDDFVFQYAQLQSMDFQENGYSSNLTSVLAFYAYLILAMDFDSYSLYGGQAFYDKAMAVRNAAINIPGWGPQDGKGNRNRYYLIENLIDDRFKPLRTAFYQYHLKGLDLMSKDIEAGRNGIYDALLNVKIIFEILPNSAVIKVFFNAKSTELINIYSKASPSTKNKVFELLSKIDPSNRNNYETGIIKK